MIASSVRERSLPRLAPAVSNHAELAAALLDALIHVLRTHTVMQRIIAWALSEANGLTLSFTQTRGRALGAWVARTGHCRLANNMVQRSRVCFAWWTQ